MLERRERLGMAALEGLSLRGLVSQEGTFGGDLREAHEVVLQGFVVDETTLFLELVGTEGFEFRILETAVEGGKGRGRVFFSRWEGGMGMGGWSSG